jgi:DNA-binding NarL/FixJ family response regulator
VGVPLDPPLEGPPANFAIVFEEAPEAMLLIGDDRAFLAGNRRARELLAVTPEELLSMRIDDIAGDGIEERWAAFREAGEQAGSVVVRARDGTEHDAEIVARADFEPGRHLAILRPVAPPRAVEGGKLSAREREVLRMLASGATGSEVAAALFLSRATVATHVRNAMVKLGAHTRIEAVVIALRQGEIDL